MPAALMEPPGRAGQSRARLGPSDSFPHPFSSVSKESVPQQTACGAQRTPACRGVPTRQDAEI
jgi:hypothetical protein